MREAKIIVENHCKDVDDEKRPRKREKKTIRKVSKNFDLAWEQWKTIDLTRFH